MSNEERSVFVWEDVPSGLTSNYHDGGGVVVVAAGLDAARMLLRSLAVKDVCTVFTVDPSFVAPVTADDDKVFIFPDAGCC